MAASPLLAQRSAFTFRQPAGNDHSFGASVAIAGDVDNDGFADVVVGSLFDPTSGSTFVDVYAGRDGRLLQRLQAAPPIYYGAVVAGTGDVDRDGHDDVLIGAQQGNVRGAGTGRAVVFSGRTWATIHTIDGEAADIYLGAAVAGARDVDRDGVPDFVAAAPLADRGAINAGSVRVYSGRTGALLHRLDGASSHEMLGRSVELLADVNADGHADILIGSALGLQVRSGKDASLLYALPGLNATFAAVGDANADAATDFVTSSASGVELRSGKNGSVLRSLAASSANAVAGAGDVDRDGVVDIAAGFAQTKMFPVFPPIGPGYVDVYSGRDGRLLFQVTGDQPDDRFGVAVAGGGDVNGDGSPDLVAGATIYEYVARPGYVRVVSGAPLSLSAQVHEVSLAASATQALSLVAPAAHASKPYLVLGSLGGTRPGFQVGAVHVPLAPEAYFWLTASLPSGFLVQGGAGNLDASGRASATFTTAGLPASLAGLRLDHAFVVLGAGPVDFASNPVSVRLVP